jgi:beta-1,4-mannosyl-glycoprotein beta-1,4-N-acetylglucosaminyltransferase
MFFQELDMLELRFNILDPVVDYFVVCEAEETHSGQPKPLNLLANWDRFKPWQNKIVYINAGRLSDAVQGSWEREHYHRSKIADGLTGAKSEDWVIVADCDEIPRPEIVAEVTHSNLQATKLEVTMYYYDFNHRVDQGWAVGMYRHWIERDPNKIRSCAGYNPTQIMNAGWHFSYFGGPQAIIEKRQAFMHAGDPVIRDLPDDPTYIANRIALSLDLYGRDLKIDHVPTGGSLPRYVLENMDRYRELGWCE